VLARDDIGLGVQKLVDALLAGRGPLHQAGGPAQGRHRPGEHVDVDEELGNGAGRDAAGQNFLPAHVNGNDGAQANEKQDQRKKQRVDEVELQRFVFVDIAGHGEVLVGVVFPDKGLEHPDARKGFLHEGGDAG
jgi:hypothetical protein